ncbi:unnamed protein product [Blepharisma stoltei]|uniref:Kinesin-like protein n=1 Tax=Blepharisma stoltei TaxID=1481888 RepID=A0AAU9I9Z6_9CILI|nr:unnamed protein product [Blepharisma stoltei]
MFLHIPDISFVAVGNTSLETEDQGFETEELSPQSNYGSSNILVAVRCRPFSTKELQTNNQSIIRVLDANSLIVLTGGSKIRRNKPETFIFDYVFNETASQKEIFEKSTLTLIDGVLNGFNSTIFAYGATGTGKTYTMIGDGNSAGIIPAAFTDLFTKIEANQRERTYSVRMSYLEIYNESLKDLIYPSNIVLDIREDPIKGIIVSNLTEYMATNIQEVMECLNLGNQRRTVESNEVNVVSSRSHAILQIIIESRDKASGIESELTIGKLSMVDLAGSERNIMTNNKGIRLIEGSNINKSLLALGNCINALSERNERGGRIFIPYRDSKLTRLLKDSLGGNCKTVMIACISPYFECCLDTLNTLKYARRAKTIKTCIKRNIVNTSHHIANYTTIIAQLRQEVSSLKSLLIQNKSGNFSPVGVEGHQIEINKHFQAEAKIRKKLFKIQQWKDDIGFILFSKQTELNHLKSQKERDENLLNSLGAEIETLTASLNNQWIEEEKMNIKLKELESKRNEFYRTWMSSGLSESQLSSLKIYLKENIFSMNMISLNKGKKSESSFIKQKDAYIKQLEEQLKLRDNIIKKNQKILKDSNLRASPELKEAYEQIQTLKEVNSSSILTPDFSSKPYTSLTPGPSDKSLIFPPVLNSQRSRLKRKSEIIPPNFSLNRPKRKTSFESPKRTGINFLHPEASKMSLHNRSLSGIKAKAENSYSQISIEKNKPKSKAPANSIADKYKQSLYIQRPSKYPIQRKSRIFQVRNYFSQIRKVSSTYVM